jgi:hypothetical protein
MSLSYKQNKFNKLLKKARPNKDTHRLPIIYNTQACLFHDGMQLLPGLAPISRSIDRACVGMHENDLVG